MRESVLDNDLLVLYGLMVCTEKILRLYVQNQDCSKAMQCNKLSVARNTSDSLVFDLESIFGSCHFFMTTSAPTHPLSPIPHTPPPHYLYDLIYSWGLQLKRLYRICERWDYVSTADKAK